MKPITFSDPPKAPGLPIVGKLFELRGGVLPMYQRMLRQQGRIVRYDFAGFRACMITDAPAFQRILRDNAPNYTKTVLYKKMQPLVGLGLLTSDGDLWRRQRRLAQPSFHRPKMEGFANVMLESTRRMVDRWRTQERVELTHEMMELTLDVVARSLLGGGVESETDKVKAAVTVGLQHLMHKLRVLIDIPESIPTPRNLRFNRVMRGIEDVVTKIIAKRRSEASPSPDLLNSLLRASDEGGGMSEKQLRDEIITMFLAGQETTATALCWTLYLLDGHPDVEAQVCDELERVLAGREPTAADIPQLKYLSCVIQESLRLYPPAWWYGRTPIEDDSVGGYRLQKGLICTMIPYLMHRDPEYWTEAEKFDPLRFSEERQKDLVPYAYSPFAAGPRMCIGKDFALIEMHLTLALLFQCFRLRRESKEPVAVDPGITLRPKGEIWVRVQAR